MKWPKFDRRTAKAAGAGFVVVIIMLFVIFATPLMGTDKLGLFSVSEPSVGGEVGKIPSPAYEEK